MRAKCRNNKTVVHTVPTTANYLRFLAFLMSGSYAPLVLIPRLQWYISGGGGGVYPVCPNAEKKKIGLN
jgi:hypothetical protein